MNRGVVHFVINLLQDVNVARPLAILARAMGFPVSLLVSHKFRERDSDGQWWRELQALASEFEISITEFATPLAAYIVLQRASGMLVACSESSLQGHDLTHELHKIAPSGIVRVTLQHGFECVGFLHNRDHDRAHGRDIRFAADIICGWCQAERLKSVAPTERNKLWVTGPTAQILPQEPATVRESTPLVCENLHSVRLRSHASLQGGFIDTFQAFAQVMMSEGDRVLLRPHPGGRYSVKNKTPLPDGVSLNLEPIYKTSLGRYAFGVSAPSSIVIDMVLSGLPVGVWQDVEQRIDTSNYAGLTMISALPDWLALARDARIRREMLVARQQAFLRASGLIHEPTEVRARFTRLLQVVMANAENVARPRIAG